MEMIRAAENEAKEMKETAERERRERLQQVEQEVEKLREDHRSQTRVKDQEILAQHTQKAQAEAEETIMNGREATARLEAMATEKVASAVDAVLRKVL